MTALEVDSLTVAFPGPAAPVAVVRQAALRLEAGEMVGLVGESGSGKSLTALAMLGLLPAGARVGGGSVRLAGRELLGLPERELRAVRGGAIGLVFQEPLSALNPVLTIGRQVREALRAHRSLSREQVATETRELLDLVALPARLLESHPHQLSGGQRQRVLLMLALAGRPSFLLADEPTTALDVTVQAQILALLADLRRELGLGILLITHDLAVVAESCSRAYVMYAGEIVEEGPVPVLFSTPGHPYTAGLLAALPRLGTGPAGRAPAVRVRSPTRGISEGCALPSPLAAPWRSAARSLRSRRPGPAPAASSPNMVRAADERAPRDARGDQGVPLRGGPAGTADGGVPGRGGSICR